MTLLLWLRRAHPRSAVHAYEAEIVASWSGRMCGLDVHRTSLCRVVELHGLDEVEPLELPTEAVCLRCLRRVGAL